MDSLTWWLRLELVDFGQERHAKPVAKIKVQLIISLYSLVGLKLKISNSFWGCPAQKSLEQGQTSCDWNPYIWNASQLIPSHSAKSINQQFIPLSNASLPRHPWIPTGWFALFEDPCRKCASSSAWFDEVEGSLTKVKHLCPKINISKKETTME